MNDNRYNRGITFDADSIKEGISTFFIGTIDLVITLIKWTSILIGVLAAQLADAGFGTIALGFLFSGSANILAGLSVWILNINPNTVGFLISLGGSAFQIFAWSLMHKRGIGVTDLFRFRHLPKDIQQFMSIAIGMWFIDTAIDISPISLMIKNSTYGDSGFVYDAVVVLVYIMVIILCGFSEVLTTNIKDMFSVGEGKPKPKTQPMISNKGKGGGSGSGGGGGFRSGGQGQHNFNATTNRVGSTKSVQDYLAQKKQSQNKIVVEEPADEFDLEMEEQLNRMQGFATPTYHP